MGELGPGLRCELPNQPMKLSVAFGARSLLYRQAVRHT